MLRVLGEPGFDHSGMMDAEVIQNEKNLPICPFDELLEECRQHLRVHGVLVHHESYLPLVGDGRDHVERGPFGRESDHRRFSFGGIAASMLAITANSGLVPSVDLGPFVFGPLRNRGILLLEPRLHGGRALFIRMF